MVSALCDTIGCIPLESIAPGAALVSGITYTRPAASFHKTGMKDSYAPMNAHGSRFNDVSRRGAASADSDRKRRSARLDFRGPARYIKIHEYRAARGVTMAAMLLNHRRIYMIYRRLGSAGIKVSALSLGSWVTYGTQVDIDQAVDMIKLAYDSGVNFFDNAEVYSLGKSETIMGEAFRRLDLRRASYLVSTKLYWGLNEGPNEKNTLNSKYLHEAMEGSLERLGMDHVDFVFCHRPDPETPVEETVWAMHDIVSSGKAFYWGTSEWSAEEIREAWEIADRRNLRRPQMEQPLYNMISRRKVEREFAKLYDGIGLGLTTFSPLASGLLSGKYGKGVPEGTRFALPGYEWLKKRYFHDDIPAIVGRLEPIAQELGCTMSQLGIAWAVRNPRVSTVITGASRREQLIENLGALEVLPRLSSAVLERIDATLEPIIE